MKIGIDFDDVLFDFTTKLCEWHNKNYGTNLKRENIDNYYLPDLFQCARKEEIVRVGEFYESKEHSDLYPVTGAVEAVRELNKNNELFIITARPETVRGVTEELVQRYFSGMFESVRFTGKFLGSGIEKSDICRNLGIDIFIDDFEDNLTGISSIGIKSLLFNAPWNQGELGSGITRVYSWSEIVENIKK
jgi:hypothetical protein